MSVFDLRMRRARWKWGLWGAAFGVCFPAVALLIRWLEGGPAGAWAALTQDPLMGIVVTAPFFLGIFAAIGGHQHDKLSDLTAELEVRVQARTRDLAAAVEQLQLITDNVAEGLLAVDLNGQLLGPVSAQARRWFEAPPPGAALLDWLRPDDEAYATFFELGFEQLRDGYLPAEVALDQLPRNFEREGRHYELEARLLPAGAKAPGLLVVIRDVTDRRALAEERAQAEERHAVIANLLRDPNGFVAFRNDCRALLDECKAATSAPVNKAALHTLKGTAAVYGFHSFSSLCHDLEGELIERAQGLLDAQQIERLERCFYAGIEQFGMFMPDESDVVRISRDELLRLAESAESALVRDELFRWTHDPVEPMLERLASYGASVAKRLDKDVTFRTQGGGARLDLQRSADFVRRLHHLVRNAIDHGVESREERLKAGKPATATITLSARPSPSGTILCVDDDGRGIDWAKVSERAAALGRPHITPEEQMRALVEGGLSTRREVTEISGRGIGLGAVWSSAAALGIEATLESTPGRGTSVRFVVPRAPLISSSTAPTLPSAKTQRTPAQQPLTTS